MKTQNTLKFKFSTDRCSQNRCYLCGKEIVKEVASDDHVIPKQFIKRKQPRTKGFDYAGILPTHEECNNRFGSEKMCQKALQLISVLYNPECSILQHKDNPDIKIQPIVSDNLSEFTNSDLKFFKIIDARNTSCEKLTNPEFYKDKQKTELLKQSLNIALSVLVKSAAAVLVSRYDVQPSTKWRILCIPYVGASEALDFDELFGDTKPFEVGVKLWIKQLWEGLWFASYKCQSLLVYIFFWFSNENTGIDEIKHKFEEADHFYFEGSKLITLSEYDWTKNR